MLLAVFDEVNFTAVFAGKYWIEKLIKMTVILVNNMSKKTSKKMWIEKCNSY